MSMLTRYLLGDLPEFRCDPLGCVERRSRNRLKPVEFRFGTKRVVFVHRPSAVRHVLIDHADRYDKGDHQARLRPLLGDGMITARGERWNAARRAARDSFRAQGLADGLQLALRELMRQIMKLPLDGRPIDLPGFTGRLTIRMATAAMFHTALDDDTAGQVYEAAAAAHHWVSDVMWQPLHIGTWLPTPSNRRFRNLLAVLEEAVVRLEAEPKGALAALAAGLQDRHGRRALRDEVITLLLAGFETSGTTASWLLYALASRPDVVEWLREEVDSLLADGQDLTPQMLRDMPRTRAVVDETMRLWPATWWFARVAQRDDVIDDLKVKAGTSVFICPWLLHRQPDLWPDPENFEPRRFMERPADSLSYIPFGAGARTCIGQHLARAEFMAIAALMTNAFDLHPLSGDLHHARPLGGITLAPPVEGLSVGLVPRAPLANRRVA